MSFFAEVGIELERLKEKVLEGYVKACTNPDFQLEIGKGYQLTLNYFRPTEVDLLIGDPTKQGQKLGWECNMIYHW
jgi:GDPmannose 4,6-dehydratase